MKCYRCGKKAIQSGLCDARAGSAYGVRVGSGALDIFFLKSLNTLSRVGYSSVIGTDDPAESKGTYQ